MRHISLASISLLFAYGNAQISTACVYTYEAVSGVECPDVTDIQNCETANMDIGDLCEGDGECGTDVALDNCGFAHDIYRVTGFKAPGHCSFRAECQDNFPNCQASSIMGSCVNNNDFQLKCRASCQRCIFSCADRDSGLNNCWNRRYINGEGCYQTETTMRYDCERTCELCACDCSLPTNDFLNVDGCFHCVDTDDNCQMLALLGGCDQPQGTVLDGYLYGKGLFTVIDMAAECKFACGQCPGQDRWNDCPSRVNVDPSYCYSTDGWQNCRWSCVYGQHYASLP